MFLDPCVPAASVGPQSDHDESGPAGIAAASGTVAPREMLLLVSVEQKLPNHQPLSVLLKSLTIYLMSIKSKNNLAYPLRANVAALTAHFYK